MTTLHDIKESSDVTIKQIHDHYKKNIVSSVLEQKSEIVKEVMSMKTNNRRTPLSKISEQLDIPKSTLRSYMHDMDVVNKRKQMSTSQKNETQKKMQIGKAKARYSRNEITEEEYKTKVSEIEKKFESLISDNNDVSKQHSTAAGKKNRRGGYLGDEQLVETTAQAPSERLRKMIEASSTKTSKIPLEEIDHSGMTREQAHERAKEVASKINI
jgi:hypothetical protein